MTSRDSVDPAEEAKRRLLEMLEGDLLEPAPDTSDIFTVSLVRMKTDGRKRPFFMVNPGSGTASPFRALATKIDDDRPFYAFQPPGIDGECEPVADLRELASGYLRQVKKVQPKGPYLLGGWSAGGVIAFQMAHELRAAGEEVARVVMCDTVSQELLQPALPLSRAEMKVYIHRQLAQMVEHLARQRGVELPEGTAFERFQKENPKFLVNRVRLTFEILKEAGVFESLDTPIFKVFRANVTAVATYDMPREKLDVKLALLRCENKEFGLDLAKTNPSYEWGTRTTHEVEVHPMPSHHFALFSGDVLPISARALQRILDAADAEFAR